MILCAAFAAAFAAGCSEPVRNDTVSMFDLSRAMLQAHGGETVMAYASSSDTNAAEQFAHVSSIDYDKTEAYFILYAQDGKESADEIVVIAVKDIADVAEAKQSLAAHAQKRHDLYAAYEPKHAAALDNAVIFTKAQYAVMIVSPNSGAVRKAFEDFTDQNK